MKISCICGSRIIDTSDNLPNKAHLVPDQDFDAACLGEDPIPAELRRWDDVTDQVRSIWQCEDCGRLCLDGPNGLVWFRAESGAPAAGLLQSVYGERWSGPLRGHWNAATGSGELFWTEGAGESHFEDIGDFTALVRRYDEVFADLHARGLVRDAFLNADGRQVRYWARDTTAGSAPP